MIQLSHGSCRYLCKTKNVCHRKNLVTDENLLWIFQEKYLFQ